MGNSDRLKQFVDTLRAHPEDWDGYELPRDSIDSTEVSLALLKAIIPRSEDEEISIPMTLQEFREFFVEAGWHFDESWSQFPSVKVTTEDGRHVVVRFGDTLTCEIVDVPRANGDWSYECKSVS